MMDFVPFGNGKIRALRRSEEIQGEVKRNWHLEGKKTNQKPCVSTEIISHVLHLSFISDGKIKVYILFKNHHFFFPHESKNHCFAFWDTQDNSRRWRIKAWNLSPGKHMHLWGLWVGARRRSSGRKRKKTATISAKSSTESLTHSEKRSELLPLSNSLLLLFCSLLSVFQYCNTYCKPIRPYWGSYSRDYWDLN